MVDTERWMNEAKTAIGKMEAGTCFSLRDLFEGVVWEAVDKGDRQNLGRYFKNRVRRGDIADVEHIGKKANNSAYYRKL